MSIARRETHILSLIYGSHPSLSVGGISSDHSQTTITMAARVASRESRATASWRLLLSLLKMKPSGSDYSYIIVDIEGVVFSA